MFLDSFYTLPPKPNPYFCTNYKTLETGTVIFIVAITMLVTGSVVYIITTRTKGINGNGDKDNSATQLKLQAYERLMILVDRISLPNMITRLNDPSLTAKQMQSLLTQNIRSEFEYNITQQIYVSPEAWNALKNLKDQNILAVNQLAAVMPPNASAMDLNKMLLEFLMNDKKGNLHEVVAEALSYEARKLM